MTQERLPRIPFLFSLYNCILVQRYLEESKYSVWIDIKRLGKQALFDDIASGLACTKLVIAFVSDEYAKSDNCAMEITHAVKNLKLPTIVCAVGDPNNNSWRKTKVGMIVGYCDVIRMHTQAEHDANIKMYIFHIT